MDKIQELKKEIADLDAEMGKTNQKFLQNQANDPTILQGMGQVAIECFLTDTMIQSRQSLLLFALTSIGYAYFTKLLKEKELKKLIAEAN